MVLEVVGVALVCKVSECKNSRLESKAVLCFCVRQPCFGTGECKAPLAFDVYKKAGHSNCVLQRGSRDASTSLYSRGALCKALSTVYMSCVSDPLRSAVWRRQQVDLL